MGDVLGMGESAYRRIHLAKVSTVCVGHKSNLLGFISGGNAICRVRSNAANGGRLKAMMCTSNYQKFSARSVLRNSFLQFLIAESDSFITI